MSLSFEQKLQNYAELAVKVGLGFQAGQRLFIRAPIEGAPLVRLIAASAYRAGARLVEVIWHDDALTLARFQYAPRDSFEEYPAWRAELLAQAAEAGDAVLSVLATDPDLLKDQDLELVTTVQRVHDQHLLPFRKLAMTERVNWSIVSLPIPAWAAKIFPGEPPEQQLSKLWDTIFTICRADRPDPVAAWQQHNQELVARKDYLTARQYTALKYTGPGTDLILGLPDGHLWQGGAGQTHSGLTYIPNLPTEEVFTLPHKDQAEGVVTSTRPLSVGGVLIENFSLMFENGRVVKIAARKGEAMLNSLVETDEGSARLGEVALVPYSSPVSKSGLLFYNTLYDENAASHLALGRAYRFCLAGGSAMTEEEFAVAGGNNSFAHIDFMIGSRQMDIDGLTRNGGVEPVMRGGEWAFET